jgi:hypothetical protein
VGLGVGSEYFVFLKKSTDDLKIVNANPYYGSIRTFYRIMYDGFSVLESGYDCVFDGKEISQQCDNSVELNPDQVILPASVKVFPADDPGPLTNYHKWVRKSLFIQLLEQIAQDRAAGAPS